MIKVILLILFAFANTFAMFFYMEKHNGNFKWWVMPVLICWFATFAGILIGFLWSIINR